MELNEISKKELFVESRSANLYKLENGNIFKMFKKPKPVSEIDKFKYFLNYQNDSFVFPFEFIYDSEKFYGYITKYVKGETLEDAFSKSSLYDLSKNSLKLEKNIDYISSGGIVLKDFHEQNLLYDGKKYSAIDHDRNTIENGIKEIKIKNQGSYRTLIINLFVDNLRNIDFDHTKLIRKQIYQYRYIRIKPSELIITIKEELDKIYKEDINTLDDITQILKR